MAKKALTEKMLLKETERFIGKETKPRPEKPPSEGQDSEAIWNETLETLKYGNSNMYSTDTEIFR